MGLLRGLKEAGAGADADTVTTATRLDTLTLVPAARFGRLLTDTRAWAGASLADVAAVTEGRFDVAGLAEVEAGLRSLLDTEVDVLLAAYGLDLAAPPPRRTRLVVDPLEGSVAVVSAGAIVSLSRRGGRAAGPAVDVLSRYLGLVYTLRRVAPGTPIPLRQADLDVLADALRLDPTTVEERLGKLMGNPSDAVGRRARRFARRRMVPAAGILVATTSGGSLVLEQRPDDRPGAVLHGDPLGAVLPFEARRRACSTPTPARHRRVA